MKIVAFDLDGVLCDRPDDIEHLGPLKYARCRPLPSAIEIARRLREQGYEIVIYTSRGASMDEAESMLVRDITENQLRAWGVAYDRLVFGKEPYHLLIDDRAVDARAIKSATDALVALQRRALDIA